MTSKQSPKMIAIRFLNKFGCGPSRTNLLPVKSAPVYTTLSSVATNDVHVVINGYRIYASLKEDGQPSILRGYFAGDNRRMAFPESVDDGKLMCKVTDFFSNNFAADDRLWLPRGGRFYTSDYGAALKRRKHGVCAFIPKREKGDSIFDRQATNITLNAENTESPMNSANSNIEITSSSSIDTTSLGANLSEAALISYQTEERDLHAMSKVLNK